MGKVDGIPTCCILVVIKAMLQAYAFGTVVERDMGVYLSCVNSVVYLVIFSRDVERLHQRMSSI